jgi:tRNA threonylcarbamoyladenosine biosynthesis protein TsaB
VSTLLVLDTATAATVAGVALGERVIERRHVPAPGERPGHAAQLLPLAAELLDELGLRFTDVDRIAFVEWPEVGAPAGLDAGRVAARVSLEHRGGDRRLVRVEP